MADQKNTGYKSVTLKSLVMLGIISTISHLKKNENNYPFVTCLRNQKNGEPALPNNLYFTTKTALALEAAGIGEGDSVIGKLAKADVVQTENADGETRFKIFIPTGEAVYASKSEMMDVFGLEEDTIVDFDMELFEKEFAYNELEPAAEGNTNSSGNKRGRLS